MSEPNLPHEPDTIASIHTAWGILIGVAAVLILGWPLIVLILVIALLAAICAGVWKIVRRL